MQAIQRLVRWRTFRIACKQAPTFPPSRSKLRGIGPIANEKAASVLGGNEPSATSNAALLGFTEVLRDESKSLMPIQTAEMLRSMLEEDRYLVILIAYDAKALRAGQQRRLWSAQMSVSAAGLTFPAALDRMSGVAAIQYGRRQAAITIQNGVERPGKVDVGEIPLLGENRR